MIKRKLVALIMALTMLLSVNTLSASTQATVIESELASYPGYSVTVFVERPDTLKNRFSRECIDNVPSIGHTFIRISNGSTVNYYGFWPDAGLSKTEIITAGTVDGVVRNDYDHNWDVAKVYGITAAQYNSIKTYISQHIGDDYNVLSNNCTSFVAKALKSAGVYTFAQNNWVKPSGIQYWILNLTRNWYGYNPADVAYQIETKGYYYYSTSSGFSFTTVAHGGGGGGF